MSLFETASLVVTPNGTKASKLYAVKPTNGSGDLSVTRATTATRVNSSGLIESVSSNVPRLDYTGSTCPSILVEPQRTNLVQRSQEFENAFWNKSTMTITANNIISPDGTTNADLITSTGSTGYLYPSNTDIFNLSGGATYSYSIYIKAGTATSITLLVAAAAVYTGVYNLSTGIATTNTSNTKVSMLNIGNGWYRCVIICENVSNQAYSELQIGRISSGLNFYAYGAQLEQGSYATSYIPTTSASVTRNADIISKTAISSLIGQTEGVVFFDADVTNTTGLQIGTTDGGSDYVNSIQIAFGSSSTNVNIFNGGVVQFSYSSGISIGKKKIAIAYKNNDFALYINGVQMATDTSGTVPTLSGLFFNHQNLGTTNGKYNLISLWKTRLTNAELATLTTL